MLDAASVASEDLAGHVIRVIATSQRVSAETITIDDTFEQLKIDSLDGINLVFALESEFHISVPDEAVGNLRTIRDVVDGVAKLLAEKAARLNSVDAASEGTAGTSSGQASTPA